MSHFAEVAIPIPLAQAFSYEVPDALRDQVQPGARVLCEFHRRKMLGVVLRTTDRAPELQANKIKPIVAVIDKEPVLPAELFAFLQELGSYYFAPIGEVLRLALPAIEREQIRALKAQGELTGILDLPKTRQVGGKKVLYVQPTDVIEPAGSLRGQAAAVLALLRASGEQPVARLVQHYKSARSVVKKLIGLGLAQVEQRQKPRDPFFRLPEEREEPPQLTDAQSLAVEQIEKALAGVAKPLSERNTAHPTSFLLFGVTGSGKTEVYLRAIASCLSRGRGAVVMVPEIALTPQLVARFRARFGDDLAVLHSGLSEVDRYEMWRSLRTGRVRVAIGARSALFAPVAELGLIVVDEEHDGSFKQEEGVRYHARDMALLRAHRAGAVCVLGSATPSIESQALVRRGKLLELRLPDRAYREACLPEVTLVDLRNNGAGPSGHRLITLPLHRALEQTLAAKEQAILFLNRRGFAPSVVCNGCGTVMTCRACSVALTYHRGSASKRAADRGSVTRVQGDVGPLFVSETKSVSKGDKHEVTEEDETPRGGRLRCHYCDYSESLPKRCSSCGQSALVLEGLGTERLESTIAEAFPGARVARLDRDVAAADKSEGILRKMREGGIDILVGTQMVTKGHDLPNVTLVGVVNADAALSLPDFRSAERGFQLLVQVAGRAGRRERPGRVLIQTRSPDHPAITFARDHDVLGFLEHELGDRKEVGYPPFARLALIRVDSTNEHLARETTAKIASFARTTPEGLARRIEVLGPSVAPISRLRGRFRFRVVIRAQERAPLRTAVAAVASNQEGFDRRVRVIIDIDPVSML